MDKIFYSPETGYRSKAVFVKQCSKKGFTETEAVAFYERQSVNQLYAPALPSNIPYSSEPGRLMTDLVDISLFEKLNKGYHFILTVIDVGSRHGWAFGIANKTPTEILPHLESIYSSYKLKTFTTDDGSEFKGCVKKWLRENKIEQWISALEGRTNLVELINKIIITRLFKIMKYRGTHVWQDVLDSVVLGYNADKPISGAYYSQKLIDPFTIGDYVRVPYDPKTLNDKNAFVKNAREQKWSNEIYRILSRNRARYILIDSDNQVVDIQYLPHQMLGVPTDSTEGDPGVELEIKAIKKQRRVLKNQRKSGLDVNKEAEIIVPKSLRLTNEQKISGRKKRVPARYLV